jgi:NAD(P)H-hydrate repair Nnr-like enzyme with NAD(P)H-hydrate dehydratase domain
LSVLLGCERREIDADPVSSASTAAARFGSTIVMKDSETFVASPAGHLVVHESPCVGLGTAGSGDVLAGLIGGLLARGASAFDAGAWGVWLHGQAGAAASRRYGAIGYLARELLAEVPRLIGANPSHLHKLHGS